MLDVSKIEDNFISIQFTFRTKKKNQKTSICITTDINITNSHYQYQSDENYSRIEISTTDTWTPLVSCSIWKRRLPSRAFPRHQSRLVVHYPTYVRHIDRWEWVRDGQSDGQWTSEEVPQIAKNTIWTTRNRKLFLLFVLCPLCVQTVPFRIWDAHCFFRGISILL